MSASNNLLGAIGSIGGSWGDGTTSSGGVINTGGWLPNTISLINGGPTAVTVPDGGVTQSTIDHEAVHVEQGYRFGPLYLVVTVIGYGIGFVDNLVTTDHPFNWDNMHDASPLEREADRKSRNRNPYNAWE